MNSVSSWIFNLGMWPLIVALVLNLMFRRYGKAAIKKRMASLYHTLSVFAVTAMAAFIVQKGLNDTILAIGVLIVLGVLIILRKKAFPYQLTCAECATRLDIQTIYFMDNNLCSNCNALSST